MKLKKRHGGRRNLAKRDQQTALCSLDIVTGAQNLATLSPMDRFDWERRQHIRGSFKLSREWHEQNWFVEQVNLLKAAFSNYGLRLVLRFHQLGFKVKSGSNAGCD